jgi:hypothetical protein
MWMEVDNLRLQEFLPKRLQEFRAVRSRVE